MHDTIRVNASPNQDLHCSSRGMLKGRVILMPYPQSTCYWTLRPFVLFQFLPVDQARTRQWHLHLGLQRCHSQVRMACSICTTFLFQYLFWNTGTLTLVLLLLCSFFLQIHCRAWRGGTIDSCGENRRGISSETSGWSRHRKCQKCSQLWPRKAPFLALRETQVQCVSCVKTFFIKHETTCYCRCGYFYIH